MGEAREGVIETGEASGGNCLLSNIEDECFELRRRRRV